MANQSKLKAWVRYDGTGRVVTAGPIFQANKPKVGNWRQINSGLCCNGSSTTTTTTQGGGSVTPTAFVKGYWLTTNDSCITTLAGSLVFYSASTDVQAGITVFSDAALTTPVTEGYVIYSGPMMAETRYLVGAGGVLSVYTCPTITTTTTTTTAYVGQYYNADYLLANACAGTGQWSLPLIVDTNACTNGNIALAFGTYADYGISDGSYIYININNGTPLMVQVSGSSQMSFGCQTC